MKDSRIKELDFIRALCAIGIISYHFCTDSASEAYKGIFMGTPTTVWGGTCVAIFFLMSGFLLEKRYHGLSLSAGSLKNFYYKRWLSIFPSFYLVYIVCFIDRSIKCGTPKWGGAPWKIILSVLGLDGYLLYRTDDYYLIGEWFLGAIILLYLLYPLISAVFAKAPVIVSVVSLGAFIWVQYAGFFKIPASRNLITCIFYFVTGMLISRYKLNEHKILVAICALIGLLSLWVKIPGLSLEYYFAVTGIFSFFLLYLIGHYAMKLRIVDLVISRISKVSFQVFLLQHMIIVYVLQFIHPLSFGKAALSILGVTCTSIILADVLFIITRRITDSLAGRSRLFRLISGNPR